MKVRMKTRACGPQMSAEPGQVIEVDAATAQALLAGGFAEPVRETPVETAQLPPVEKAVTRRGKAKQ